MGAAPPSATLRDAMRLFLGLATSLVLVSSTAFAQDFATPYGTPPPPRLDPHSVSVHLVTSDSVSLQILMPDAIRWTTACDAPCDAQLPLEAVYRIVGRGLQASRNLELEGAPGDDVTLKVHAMSNDDYATGEHLALGTYIAAGVGLGLEIAALSTDPSSDAQPILLWSGIGVAGAAIGMEIASYVLRRPTSVSQSAVTPLFPRPRPVTSGWTRSPVWRDLATVQLAPPAAPSVPVFSTTF